MYSYDHTLRCLTIDQAREWVASGYSEAFILSNVIPRQECAKSMVSDIETVFLMLLKEAGKR